MNSCRCGGKLDFSFQNDEGTFFTCTGCDKVYSYPEENEAQHEAQLALFEPRREQRITNGPKPGTERIIDKAVDVERARGLFDQIYAECDAAIAARYPDRVRRRTNLRSEGKRPRPKLDVPRMGMAKRR